MSDYEYEELSLMHVTLLLGKQSKHLKVSRYLQLQGHYLIHF